jgi:hypothetical protein
MNLDRALQLTTAALAIMGALFLGLGSKTTLPLALAIAALLSVTLGEVFRWLRLNRLVANLVALGAVAWSLRDFLKMGSEGQLLAIADMLVYLQIVLLFQEKSARVYWQLLVLSLLQVVVSAALNLGPQFGVLLALYLLLALLTLVLLCLYRESKKAIAVAAPATVVDLPGWQALLAPPTVESAALSRPFPARAGLVARQVSLLAAATILFAAIFFGATPRLGESAWGGPRGKADVTSGFSPEATLEEFGRIHQNNQKVMRVAFTRIADRRPYLLIGEPYFHGVTLTDYVPDEGGSRWVSNRGRRTSRYLQPSDPPAAPIAANLMIRQDIVVEATNPQSVFAVLPVQHLTDTPRDLRFSRNSNRLYRVPRSSDELSLQREYRYAFATISLRNGRQLHGLPHPNPVLNGQDQYFLALEREELIAFDSARFSRLAAIARKVLEQDGLESANEYERALALERHFHASDRYKYSLVFDFPRDKALDPIEDFVANHRTGHCEYFASALVMMLRSQGIPARMIVGYKGGEFNSLGRFYQVRQRHAHAWVEALLPPGQTPDSEIAGVPSGGGTWYRLDPTPMALDTAGTVDDEGLLDRVGETFDYVELMWRDYVLSLNSTRQKETLYDPVSSRALGAVPPWMDSGGMQRLQRRMASLFGREPAVDGDLKKVPVFDWGLGVLVAFGLGFLAWASQFVVWYWPQMRRWVLRGGAADSRRGNRPPEFYLRLVGLLSRLNLRRSSGQTAQELAAVAGNRLGASPASVAAAELPAEVVAAYYRVRFGGAALDKNEQAAIEQALAQLVSAVHQAPS